MPLYFIGLGLGDERDVTLRGAECIRSCAKVFLESYTSVLGVSKERLEAAFGRPIEIAWRETVESESHAILGPAKTSNVAFLVVGDVFGATTHTDLLMRAQDEGVETCVWNMWMWTLSIPGWHP
jgi:diphthine methyl ester synthase